MRANERNLIPSARGGPASGSFVKNLLFVCKHNRYRSPTAERLFEGADEYQAKSAGVGPTARVPVDVELVRWADMIFVMEHEHLAALRSAFKKELAGKRVICLEIPDRYGFMTPELIRKLKAQLGQYITVPD
jgi:predicted protein tyrosine phosphatase